MPLNRDDRARGVRIDQCSYKVGDPGNELARFIEQVEAALAQGGWVESWMQSMAMHPAGAMMVVITAVILFDGVDR